MKNRAMSQFSADGMVFGLVGAGGFAREVMPIVGPSIAADGGSSIPVSQQYFVDLISHDVKINGYRSISEKAFFALDCSARYFNIAIGDSRVRQRIAEAFMRMSAKPLTLQSPHAIVYDENQIGEGAILCANTIITSNTRIGRFFHANIFAYVAHDCVVGDFVTFAPNVHCNGNIHIHDHAYIGTGAVLKQGSPTKPLVIGEGAVVGMGAVVTKDVAPYTTVVGNPARPLEKR
jgi:sugar O-acyltransferase (sialic acid O-acetyltransferase NeuD family)